MPDEEPSFWEFSLQTYRRDGAEQASLFLQDECGADVNVVLLCCFVARRGVRLTPTALETLVRQASVWQREVVTPLRGVRRRLRQPVGGVLPGAAAQLSQNLKAAELEAEKLEQEMLQAVLRTVAGRDGRGADRPGLARRNLLDYLRLLQAAPEPTVRDALERLIACAFEERSR